MRSRAWVPARSRQGSGALGSRRQRAVGTAPGFAGLRLITSRLEHGTLFLNISTAVASRTTSTDRTPAHLAPDFYGSALSLVGVFAILATGASSVSSRAISLGASHG